MSNILITIGKEETPLKYNPRNGLRSIFLSSDEKYAFGDKQFSKNDLKNFEKYIESNFLSIDEIIFKKIYKEERDNKLEITTNSNETNEHIGFIYETKMNIKNEFNVKEIDSDLTDKIENRLSREIDRYNKYINGKTYQIVITDDDNPQVTKERINGIIGEDDLTKRVYFLKENYASSGNFVNILHK